MLHSPLFFDLGKTVGLGDIIYAVNCGGEAHTDVYGVQFQKDSNKVGTFHSNLEITFLAFFLKFLKNIHIQ